MTGFDVSIEDTCAVITLSRPGRRNAVSLAMWRELRRLFDEFGRDPHVRAIILTGANGDFTAGADITEFDIVRVTAAQSVAYEEAVDACSLAIATAAKPTIAAVSGYCLGGGCHLALACDFRFADKTAVFGIPAARLSIVYGVASTQRLLALVGLPAAKRILFTADRINATEALDMGLVDNISADACAAALDLARRCAGNAPLSISGAKAILNDLSCGTLDPLGAQRLIDGASDSADFREGRAAFAEKRVPVFRGE